MRRTLPFLLLLSSTTCADSKQQRIYQQRVAPSRPEGAPDVDYGGKHPFDAHRHTYELRYRSKRRRVQTTTTTDEAATTPLHAPTDSQYQPLRIAFDTSDLRSRMELSLSAGDTLAATKLFLLIYEILPSTAEVWGDILRVIPVVGGIYPLDAVGSSVDVILPNGNDDETECTGKTCRGYYEDPVRLLYCPDATAGIGGGADLLVYATVNRHCEGTTTATDSNGRRNNLLDSRLDANGRSENNGAMGTLASALSCQRDQYDRPITGSIDFCLGGMGDVSTDFNIAQAIAEKVASSSDGRGGNYDGQASEKWQGWTGKMESTANNETTSSYSSASFTLDDVNRATVQYSVGVAVHEIGHVLGVTSDSLRYFRHPITGFPLTPRPFTLSSVTCVNGEEVAYVGLPGEHVMKEVVDKDTTTNHFEVITPTVQRIIRNHFNCANATGAKLENQPTSQDCFGSHFDERLYYTEIMSAVFSQTVNVLSPLTLALLEDSGWYRANYQSEYIQISPFGHGAGCEFIEEDCIDGYGNVPEPMEEQFCNEVISVGSNGIINTDESGSQTCDPSHTSKTYCDLVDSYQLVGIGKTATLLEEPPEQFQYFESKASLRPYLFTSADYCPIPHIDPQSCFEFNGRPLSDEQLEAGEYYGSDSRCVETDGSRSYSLCLQTKCNHNLGLVQIIAGGQKRTCEYDGQIHTILFQYDGDGPLRIKCPKASLVCPELFCPANCAGRGDCLFRSKGTISTSEPQARCVCDSAFDTSDGCFYSELSFPDGYGFGSPTNQYHANKTLFLLIVGSLVAGLAVIFVVVRQWKSRQNLFM
ncbi:hypothetical protein ACHAWO_007342 [Cyclotella atomus]|uniref:Peptidase M10 metallopeptidase domain-containing protein n=1 Tax=Cyclotella atomus TaxID=382360 RepID=A0ABD3Q238_9STRA